ncbi:MAG: hypothetical protein QG627_448 [Chlamydiota bacterium]|nr:hypothetical protein [Chlamydiota bacterium]
MVDTRDLKSLARKGVQVRLLFRAFHIKNTSKYLFKNPIVHRRILNLAYLYDALLLLIESLVKLRMRFNLREEHDEML